MYGVCILHAVVYTIAGIWHANHSCFYGHKKSSSLLFGELLFVFMLFGEIREVRSL